LNQNFSVFAKKLKRQYVDVLVGWGFVSSGFSPEFRLKAGLGGDSCSGLAYAAADVTCVCHSLCGG